MNTTHFGYEEVAEGDKSARVGEVFSSVAPRYDLMNDLMSFGLHRLWKRFTILAARLRPGERVLDLAGGTGDLARLALARGAGEVVVADVNPSMLEAGRDRLLDRVPAGRLRFVGADAERLPFAPGSFDCVLMGFGLRNVTRLERALAAVAGVPPPGRAVRGPRVLAGHRSRPRAPLRPLLLLRPSPPRRARGGRRGCLPLPRRVDPHAPGSDALLEMMRAAGFRQCRYFNLSAGVVAVHRGWR